MQSRFSFRLLAGTAFATLLVACGSSTPSVSSVTSIAASATTMPAVTTQAPTITAVPSATPSPSPSASATETGTATSTNTSAPAPTAQPALPAVEPVSPPVVRPTPVPPQPPVAKPQPANARVPATIHVFQFTPSPLVVKAGTTVVWTNEDAIEHSVTAGADAKPDGGFNSGYFTQGQTFAFTFNKPGTFSYFCMRHPSMVGAVTVTP